MSYDVTQKKEYSAPASVVNQATAQMIETLGGKPSKRSNPGKGMFEANFNKKVGNNALPNRVDLQVKIESQTADQCQVLARAFPVDPLGNKLTFGVQGNAAAVVVSTFFEELGIKVTG